MLTYPRRTRPLTSDAKVSEAQARLQRLEQIVATLMQPGQNVTTTPGQTLPSCGGISCAVPDAAIGIGRTNHTGRASCPTPTQSKGYLEYGPSETTYLGATHWASILGDVSTCLIRIDSPSLTCPRSRISKIAWQMIAQTTSLLTSTRLHLTRTTSSWERVGRLHWNKHANSCLRDQLQINFCQYISRLDFSISVR